MVGRIEIRMINTIILLQSKVILLMLGDYMICMAMYGNGATIGMEIIPIYL
jgi:hypothetical protein